MDVLFCVGSATRFGISLRLTLRCPPKGVGKVSRSSAVSFGAFAGSGVTAGNPARGESLNVAGDKGGGRFGIEIGSTIECSDSVSRSSAASVDDRHEASILGSVDFTLAGPRACGL